MKTFREAVEWANKNESEDRPSIAPYLGGGAAIGILSMYIIHLFTNKGSKSSNREIMDKGQFTFNPFPQQRNIPYQNQVPGPYNNQRRM